MEHLEDDPSLTYSAQIQIDWSKRYNLKITDRKTTEAAD